MFNTKRVHFAAHVKEKRCTLQPFFVLCQHKNMQKLGKKKDQEEKKATNKAELALFQKQTVRGRGGKDFSLSTPSPKVEVLNWN